MMNEKILNKIKNKQKNIITDSDISKFGYHRKGYKKGIQQWQLYIPRDKKSLKEKIKKKQNHISTNEDISDRGYKRGQKDNEVQIWIRVDYYNNYRDKYYEKNKSKILEHSKSWYESNKKRKLQKAKEWSISHKEWMKNYQLEYSRRPKRKIQISEYYFNHEKETNKRHKEYYQSHKKEYRKYHQEYNKEHKEELKEKARIYRQTPQGKLSSRKGSHIHRKKGFIRLFELENIGNIETDYHHISKDMPFVIPVPRDIHRSIGGEKHYLEVTIKFCEWFKEHPEIKIKDELR